MQAYKRLSEVEQAFRMSKDFALEVEPIYHRREDRVICMLALYLQVHMEQALAPLLFTDHDPAGGGPPGLGGGAGDDLGGGLAKEANEADRGRFPRPELPVAAVEPGHADEEDRAAGGDRGHLRAVRPTHSPAGAGLRATGGLLPALSVPSTLHPLLTRSPCSATSFTTFVYGASVY